MSETPEVTARESNDEVTAAELDAADTEIGSLQAEIVTLRAFVDRCHELGATDTDIVKHALEDQARIRTELSPLSLQLDAWRQWAQLVYLGGGPLALEDNALRVAVNAAHDAEVERNRSAFLAELDAKQITEQMMRAAEARADTAERERDEARDTVTRLNRRCQLADAAVNTKVEDWNKRSTGGLRNCFYDRAVTAEAALALLQQAVRIHRDTRGDDRCWRDDEALYAVLPEGYTAPTRDTAVELDRCRQFIAARHNLSTTYVSPQRRIEELEAALAEARAGQAKLRAVLEKIRDGVHDEAFVACGCEHDDKYCCVVAGEYCSFCIAAVALAASPVAAPRHICGAAGYGAPGDTCPACEAPPVASQAPQQETEK